MLLFFLYLIWKKWLVFSSWNSQMCSFFSLSTLKRFILFTTHFQWSYMDMFLWSIRKVHKIQTIQRLFREDMIKWGKKRPKLLSQSIKPWWKQQYHRIEINDLFFVSNCCGVYWYGNAWVWENVRSYVKWVFKPYTISSRLKYRHCIVSNTDTMIFLSLFNYCNIST